jgi:four helix bundle protein
MPRRKKAEIRRGIGLAHKRGVPPIKSFRDLLVWQKSIDLAVRCHQIAKAFPRDEQPVLGYQVRKSALSIPSNVAEGFSRHSTAYYIQHLWTAHASGAELETQLEVGSRSARLQKAKRQSWSRTLPR